MATRYEVRQQVRSVKERWLVCVFDSPSDRVATTTFEQLRAEHPDEYFELVRVEVAEVCIAYTPLGEDNRPHAGTVVYADQRQATRAG